MNSMRLIPFMFVVMSLKAKHYSNMLLTKAVVNAVWVFSGTMPKLAKFVVQNKLNIEL